MQNNNWNIDLAHSAISFSVRHMVFAKVRGQFTSWTGQANLDLEDLTRSTVHVEIEANSINTGVHDRDSHLRSGDFLDAEGFPTIDFRSTAIEPTGESAYRLRGILTIRGQQREVALEAEYGGRIVDPWGNQRVAFTAKGSVARSDFNLTWNQTLEAGGVLVGDSIDIELEVQATRQSAAEVA